MKKIFFLMMLVGMSIGGYCQNKKMDSLKLELQNAKQDTKRLRLYSYLCEECEEKDILKYADSAVILADKLISQTTNDKERKSLLNKKANAFGCIQIFYQTTNDTNKVLEYVQKALSIYQELKDTAAIIERIIDFSRIYSNIGNFPKAIEYCQKGLSYAKEMNYKKGIVVCLSQMSSMYGMQGDYLQALDNLKNILAIDYELKDTIGNITAPGSADVLIEIGNIYDNLHDIKNALESYHKGISLFEAMNNKEKVLWVYNCIGVLYANNNDITNALINYQKGLSMAEDLHAKFWIRGIFNNIGNIYLKQGDIEKAIEYHSKALKVAEEMTEYTEYNVAGVLEYLAKDYFELKNYKKAKEYKDRYEVIMKKYIYQDKRKLEMELLASQIDSITGNGNGAYQHYQKYIKVRDKLNSEDVHKAALKEKYQSDYDKQKAIDKAEQDKKDTVQKLIRNGLIGGLIIVLMFSVVFFRQRNKISKEKKRSDDLLLNILPAEVAEELKDTGGAKAKSFDEVTVMFTDFKGFTQISETMNPEQLVSEIDYCFSAFDEIIQKYGIEKIKTIGDSYMCAGGLPVKNIMNPDDVVNAAIEIRDFILNHKKEREAKGEIPFEVRIGIHTGPVVAGIVGIKKFAYDIWGDTVNLASRMESSGEPGKVNISGATYELVKDKFKCTYRGKVQAKNKGEVDMYFVEKLKKS
jgi:class 3 adenylate cyclase